jgi:hypothetical protein
MKYMATNRRFMDMANFMAHEALKALGEGGNFDRHLSYSSRLNASAIAAEVLGHTAEYMYATALNAYVDNACERYFAGRKKSLARSAA